MKKIFLSVFFFTILLSGISLSCVYAQTNDPVNPFKGTEIESPVTDFKQIISTEKNSKSFLRLSVDYLFWLSFIFVVFFILLSAYNFITSRGDEKKLTLAKNTLKWAVVGLAVALLSWTIPKLIENTIENPIGENHKTTEINDPGSGEY